MMQDHKDLFNRFLNRECSREEVELLLEYFRTEEGDKALVDLIESRLVEETDIVQLTEEDREIISRIGKRIEQANRRPYRKLKRWLPYAAAVLLVSFGLSWLLLARYMPDSPVGEQQIDLASEDIFPGGNQATLKLSDGRIITLDEAQNSIIVGPDNITYGDGELPVLVGNEFGTSSTRDTLTLSTPRGGIYQVTLADGSKIWLNAETTLKYPARFDQNQRVVHLEGEAFFEVAPHFAGRSVIPFKVISNGQEVEVLGTKFNVSAYKGNKQIRTTLTEGKVRVAIGNLANASGATAKNIMLNPGQQAIASGQTLHVKNVNTEPYTAWKDGFFYFDDAIPQVAVAELARWYDLDVDYEGKIPEVRLFGIIDRDKPLSAVLKSLKKSGLSVKLVRSSGRNKLIVLGEE